MNKSVNYWKVLNCGRTNCDCSMCPNFGRCTMNMHKRYEIAAKRRRHALIMRRMPAFVIIALCCSITLVVYASNNEKSNVLATTETSQNVIIPDTSTQLSIPQHEAANVVANTTVTVGNSYVTEIEADADPAIQEKSTTVEDVATVENEETVSETVEEVTVSNNVLMSEPTNEVEPLTVENNQPSGGVSAFGPSGSYVYNISEQDRLYIAQLIYKEARGECYEGKVAVAAVVLNRYFSGNGDFNTSSIYAVITQPGQFASIAGVSRNMISNDIWEAVDAACQGYDPTRAYFPNGALYFYAPAGVSGYQAQIRENIRVMPIGNHNFHYDFVRI